METDCNISFVRQKDSLLLSLHAKAVTDRPWRQRHRAEHSGTEKNKPSFPDDMLVSRRRGWPHGRQLQQGCKALIQKCTRFHEDTEKAVLVLNAESRKAFLKKCSTGSKSKQWSLDMKLYSNNYCKLTTALVLI